MATFTTIKNRGGGRGALAGVLQYIRQDEKTLWEGHRLVSGWNCTCLLYTSWISRNICRQHRASWSRIISSLASNQSRIQ